MTSPPLRTLRLDNIIIPLDEIQDPGAAAQSNALRNAVAKRLSLPPETLLSLDPLKRSVDTRGTPRAVYSTHVTIPATGAYAPHKSPPKGSKDASPIQPFLQRVVPPHRRDARCIVIGTGPAGLFAALTLARAGLKPIVLEQGKPVETRARDVSRLMHWGQLQMHSNLCFGEGGAGTWSDGKLTTRISAPEIRHVLATLSDMGGPRRILLDGKPHLGTDKLIAILKQFRAHLYDCGAEIRFNSRVAHITPTSVLLSCGESIQADAVVLATGHSSRPLYHSLYLDGVALQPKPFAVGFRVEHPQETINAIQYGRFKNDPRLPAADYRVTANIGPNNQKRGIYSFCMCPGGQIVPTPTEPGGVVVNGMSHAARSGPWANSALVVTVSPNDFPSTHPLAGIDFQRSAEYRAGALGGGLFRAPAQTVTGFLKGQVDTTLRKTSYTPGVTSADLSLCYPSFITESLRCALRVWMKKIPPFVSSDALLLGVETRTSAPVQITRDPKTLRSISHPHLYPCGEGAGYGGGIVSAAVDGLRVAEAILDTLDAQAKTSP